MPSLNNIRVGPSRYEFNDPAWKQETRKWLEEIENNLINMVKRKPIKQNVDRSLSHRLVERTNRCIEAGLAKNASSMYFRWPLHAVRQGEEVNGLEEHADYATVARPEQAIVEVKIEPKSKPRPLPPRVENWMDNFLRKQTRKRVQWSSKLYAESRGHDVQPREELMDAGAQDFVKWLNGLGAERSSLTKDIVKQLFYSGSSDETTSALNIAPREIQAVPDSVAQEWNVQHLALGNRIVEVLNHDRKRLTSGCKRRIAFGRTLPRHLSGEVVKMDDGKQEDDAVERPNVPEDLMSLERLFRDIWHLRSVKYLVDYLNERPSLPRPQFLVDKGLFQRKETLESIPFYRKVLSQKALSKSMGRKII